MQKVRGKRKHHCGADSCQQQHPHQPSQTAAVLHSTHLIIKPGLQVLCKGLLLCLLKLCPLPGPNRYHYDLVRCSQHLGQSCCWQQHAASCSEAEPPCGASMPLVGTEQHDTCTAGQGKLRRRQANDCVSTECSSGAAGQAALPPGLAAAGKQVSAGLKISIRAAE